MNRIHDYQPYDHQQVEAAYDAGKQAGRKRAAEVYREVLLPKIYARIERERREAWASGFVAATGLAVLVMLGAAIGRWL